MAQDRNKEKGLIMHTYWRRLWIGALLSAVGIAEAGTLNPARVPADASFVAHLDIEALRKSDIGAFLFEQLETPEVETKFAEVTAALGMDIRKDLRSVTMYGLPGSGPAPAGAVLLEGNFDRQRVQDAVATQADYRTTAYGNTVVHQWTNKENQKTTYAAFLSDGILVMSDRLEATHFALDLDRRLVPSLATRPGLIPARWTAAPPMLYAVIAMDQLPRPQQAPALQGARRGFAALSEWVGQLSLEVAMEFETAEQAEQLRKIVEGFTAMAALNAEQNPDLAELAQKIQVVSEGQGVRMSLRWPTRKVREAIERARAGSRSPDLSPVPVAWPPAP